LRNYHLIPEPEYAMTTNRRILCGVYATISAVALVATWSQNLAYLHSPGGFLTSFLGDLKVNAASRSITVDILLFFLAAAIFMVREARRLRVPYVWAYIVGGMLIAISVTFPLFLIARERKLAEHPDRLRLTSMP
jgi:amino acid permease